MADKLSSFWSPVTSHERCENNCLLFLYSEVFQRTTPNIPCILLPLIGLIDALIDLSNITLAIGSRLYHATLHACK